MLVVSRGYVLFFRLFVSAQCCNKSNPNGCILNYALFCFIQLNGGDDCNGHGTHCGGTASGTSYGIAAGTQVRSVRVLSCFGSGSWTNVITGAYTS